MTHDTPSIRGPARTVGEDPALDALDDELLEALSDGDAAIASPEVRAAHHRRRCDLSVDSPRSYSTIVFMQSR